MAVMIPLLSENQLKGLPSRGESLFYRTCREALDDSWTVLYSVSWISRQPRQHAQDGEADFILISANEGMLVIEVKSGGIVYNASSDQWNSSDYYGHEHIIKNPFRQARQSMYNILEKLRENPEWVRIARKKINIGYAVVLPHVLDKGKLISPERPQELIATQSDLSSAKSWILKTLRWWKNEDSTIGPITQGQVSIIVKTFARSFSARVLVSQRIVEEEKQRITLTMQQGRILRALGSRRRAAIRGGAGTGKTVLALEKVRSLAGEGFRTLFLCFNRPLGIHLQRLCASDNVVFAGSFHRFATEYVQRMKGRTHVDYLHESANAYPGADFYQVQLPYAFALAAETKSEPIDALVIDEGQDFLPEYWLPLELLLDDPQRSPLYIFYDSNQAIYAKQSGFPITPADEFELTVNCRNTKAIHEVAYTYYRGSPVDPPEIAGVDVIEHHIRGMKKQSEAILELIVSFLKNERVPPEALAVLIVDPYLKKACQDLLFCKPLPAGCEWLASPLAESGKVRVDSVHRFKGLEVAIGILWGLDGIDVEKDREVIYIALSRPISELHLVGNQELCTKVLIGGVENQLS